jgi:hypothetical protein
MEIDQFNNWNIVQQIVAHAAGAGSFVDASDLLGLNGMTGKTDDPYWAPGWAWRGLALHRLGRENEARESFAEAERCGRTSTPQSRTWREWEDIALTYALADDWKAVPGDERTRMLQSCRVIELWAHRHDSRRYWAW